RVPLDVANRAADLVRVIQKDLPAASTGPDGMIGRSVTGGAKSQAADFLERLDHLLGLVLVLADQDMDMVGHDGARIASVALFFYRRAERRGNFSPRRIIKGKQRVTQHGSRLLVEPPHDVAGWLNSFSPVMQLAQLGDETTADLVGTAAARVVRQPPAVGGPDQMVRDHERLLRHGGTPGSLSRKRLNSRTRTRCSSVAPARNSP